jgi:hypothetical protein
LKKAKDVLTKEKNGLMASWTKKKELKSITKKSENNHIKERGICNES